MNYPMLHEVLNLLESFDSVVSKSSEYEHDITGFKRWIADSQEKNNTPETIDWEGKNEGRSPDSVISTLLVHLNRYAKMYSKAAIHESEFSTQEDFIYLINLKAFGQMSKMELIKKNIQDKPTGMQIINRLVAKGWVDQKGSDTDKRSKTIRITEAGLNALALQMDKIRRATRIVTGNLSGHEKLELIRLLGKLDRFHEPVFLKNFDSSELLERATKDYLTGEF